MRGVDFGELQTDPAYREALAARAEAEGVQALHDELRACDPTAADAIHPNNVKRVIRALEICRVTGRKKSEIDRENSRLDGVYEPLAVGLF